jgi:hypothetical protein
MTLRSNLAAALLVWAMLSLFAGGAPWLHAQDKERKPPEGWKKVTAAQFAKIGAIMARDGYLCWEESRLVPETAQNRAQSFERRLYRLRLGEPKAEEVYRTVTTGLIEPLLGPGGAIATRHDYPQQHLFLPGQPPVKLPQVEGYHPKEFTSGGLLCHAQRYHGSGGYYESSLALIPIVEGKARVEAAQLLLPWVVGDLAPAGFNRWGTFRRGDYLIYGLQGLGIAGKSGKRKPGKPMLTVWNEKTKSNRWDAEGIPIAADDRYVYSSEGAGTAGALVRRLLAGHGEGSRLSVPELDFILDFRPPKVLGLFRQKEEWVLSLLDLESGERADFDVRVPASVSAPAAGADAQNRPLYLRPDGQYQPFLPIARDADKGVLYAARGTGIHEVPVVARRRVIDRPVWEPLP